MQILNKNVILTSPKLIYAFKTAYLDVLKTAGAEPSIRKCSQKYLNRILTFEERVSSDTSVTGRLSPLFASSSSGAASFCATGDSFSLYALSRFGLVL